MRRLLSVSAAILAAGCAPTFDVPVSGSSTVPQGNLVTCTILPAFSGFGGFDISQTDQFKNAGATKSNVRSVKVVSLTLKVTAPPGAGLGFLQSLSFDAADPSGNLPPAEIAHASDFSGDPTTVTMTVDGAELAPYAVLPSMNITTNAKVQSCPAQDTTIEADIVFAVQLAGC